MSDIDFNTVDTLRKALGLNKKSMSTILGVSRVTYHHWLKGNSQPRGQVSERVRARLRKLVVIVRQEGWPPPQLLSMDAGARYAYVLELMNKTE
jgi:DNA-binding transcriptional regulator YiaG